MPSKMDLSAGAAFIERHWRKKSLSDEGWNWGRRLVVLAEGCDPKKPAAFSDRVNRSGNAVETAMAAKLSAQARRDDLMTRIARATGPIDKDILDRMFFHDRTAEAIADDLGRPQDTHYYRLRIIDALNLLGTIEEFGGV